MGATEPSTAGLRAEAGADAVRFRLSGNPAEWRTVPWSYGLLATLRVLGGFWLAVAAAPWLVLFVSPWTLLLLVPALGVFAYKLTILMHDCSHKVLFPAPWANKLVGELSAGILGSDFRQFSRIHWLHHQYLSAPEDPQRPDYVSLREATVGRILWHLLSPLLGWNVLFKVIQYNTGKMIRASGGKIAEGAPTGWMRFVPILACHALIAVLVTGFGQVWWLILLFPVSAATISLFLSQTRGFAEHVPPAGAQSEVQIRTHRPNILDDALLFTLNFNYHLEHHLHPWVPSCHLPRLHQLIGRESHTEESLSPSVLSTIARRLGQARRQHASQAHAAPASNGE